MKRISLGLTALMFVNFAVAQEGETLEERIAPVGQVNVISNQAFKQKSTNPINIAQDDTAKAPAAQNTQGQKIYEQYCHLCHEQGVLGAPKFRDAESWKARFEAKKIDGLTKSAIAGINAMPAKGTCNECSEDDIKSAIEYMLPQ